MPDAAPPATRRRADAAAAQPAAATPFWQTALQSIALFLAIQFVMKQFAGGPSTPTLQAVTTTLANGTRVNVTVPNAIPAFADRPSPAQVAGDYNPTPQRIAPMWPASGGAALDIRVYVSPSFNPPSLARPGPAVAVLEEYGFAYGRWNDTRDVHTSFRVPREVQANGTLWAHLFAGQSGSELDPRAAGYDAARAYHFARPLTQYLKKKRVRKVKNLLSGDGGGDTTEGQGGADGDEAGPVIASYYHPNFTLSVVPDSGVAQWPLLHPAQSAWFQLERTGARDASGQNGWYYPVIYLNTFWQLRDHMTELNATVDELPLHIHLNSLANWKFSLMATVDFGMKDAAAKAARGESVAGGGDGSEFEMIKTILLDSNIYLLGTTVVVGILHMIFEMLAFKNDVSHWRNKKDNVGVSVRTILANVFMQTVIFLYLMDNNENTSWMILLSQGMGIAIEAWKITKTVDVRLRPTTAASRGAWRYLPYEVAFEDKHKLSETERKTQEYDEIAYRYMYMAGVPLIVAYGIYSLMYESHRSWYSFIITTLVGSVYAYGFLLMIPSLYINYRLKSVAHMPGKAMVYKVLSTFIDDLFAFTVKMPVLHRLATLRDDVVFFIYLYQSWKYKVDHTRVNEFGQGGEEGDAEDAKTAEVKKELAGEAEAKVGAAKDAVTTASGRAGGSGSGSGSGSAKKRRG